MNTKRKLPVGLQSFVEIRQRGYVYVDKTAAMWDLVNGVKFNFLSRPRRFGKSMLVDTLQAYFEGRRELFEGLKIAELEHDWVTHPVIRLDMSCAGASPESIRSYLDLIFSRYESTYNITPRPAASLTSRFDSIILAAYRQTGQQVVILIDEYDSPLQHSWHTPEHEACTAMYREVFAVLKTADSMERFVFLTGITKFTQISLFSVLNNLSNISFEPEFATICGISEQEMTDFLMPEIEQMGAFNGWSTEETLKRLKEYYDGYHFSRLNMEDIYNPFSLVNALKHKELRSYWSSSGATTLLPKFVGDMEIHLDDLAHSIVPRNVLESSDVAGGGPETFLYQSGYLTIKGCNDLGYALGIPNEEVRQALNEMVLPALTMRQQYEVQSLQWKLFCQLGTGQVDDAMKTLRSLVADVPYSNKKLASMDMEERYRLIISTVLNAIGLRVEVERMLATGRIDLVTWLTRYIYFIELKLQNNGGAAAAGRQIRECGYTEPFKADSRKVIGLTIELDNEGKGLLGWQVME